MRVPARAAINESVELVKHSRKASAAPMTNAVLRKVPKCGNEEREARHQASFAATSDDGHELTERLGEAFAHPRWLVERWVKHYGAVAAEAICRYGQTVPATTLRRPGTDDKLHWWEVGVGVLPGELLHSARRVSSGHLNPAAGLAVQDEGSQLVAALVGHGRRILDCCAAPGGKTGAMAERNPEAEMVAVDVHPHRVRLMKRLLGESRVQLLVADARALPLDGGFDRVLVDVPCSGTGTLARNPEIKWRLTVADLADLAERQRAILQGGLAQLAAGGRLVYATCSLEPEENEMVVEAVLRETEGVAVLDVRQELGRLRDEGELAWAEVESLTRGPYLRTLPGVHPCDGFFAAVLELRPK